LYQLPYAAQPRGADSRNTPAAGINLRLQEKNAQRIRGDFLTTLPADFAASDVENIRKLQISMGDCGSAERNKF
jgi:hypothetical protein